MVDQISGLPFGLPPASYAFASPPFAPPPTAHPPRPRPRPARPRAPARARARAAACAAPAPPPAPVFPPAPAAAAPAAAAEDAAAVGNDALALGVRRAADTPQFAELQSLVAREIELQTTLLVELEGCVAQIQRRIAALRGMDLENMPEPFMAQLLATQPENIAFPGGDDAEL
ncbi:hypothetical protein OIDMADRAFT_47065 [Oidiodendron maius Zn]|uniref:Uncharacterized protein n=1 Tax=Oidiodendron maius (strain Zn) TaxID=913774 RepID=A0A0C3DYK8_OIDMZ|nr:hypothetical protein OIDMADRAFT_47065 [Oidiodendron maius Zn]